MGEPGHGWKEQYLKAASTAAVFGIQLSTPTPGVQGMAPFESLCGCFAHMRPNLQKRGLLGTIESSI